MLISASLSLTATTKARQKYISRLTMNTRNQMIMCVIANALLLLVISAFVIGLADHDSGYYNAGPSKNLIVISVKINTWGRYMVLLLMIGIMDTVDVLVNELATPILGFNVYNPDKKVITEFSKNELQFLANLMFLINQLRFTFSMMVSFTQIDLTLFRSFLGSLVSVYTIRMLLNKKTFTTESYELESLV